jgi:glycosyltransferase involved in cell wall biosynthesis
MNLPIRKAAIILTKDDPEGLKRTIAHVKPYFNTIIVGSDDQIVINESNVIYRSTTVNIFGFAAARNKMDEYARDYQIHVHIDCDEVWDTEILGTLANTVTEECPVLRIPRCNMPDGHASPDYQTRAFWYTPDVHWIGNVHETVYRGDKPYDQWKNVGTAEHVIVHLPRKTELNRPWWKQ